MMSTKDNTNYDSKKFEPFYFVVGADAQLGLLATRNSDIKDWNREIMLLRKGVEKINKMKPRPKFFIHCGDQVDAYAYDDQVREKHRQQINDFKEEINKLDNRVPFMCVPGNHDLGNFPTKETLEAYRNTFGPDYYSFWSGSCFFICLNSQLLRESKDVPDEAAKHEQWLDEQLIMAKTNRCKHCIVFQHIPWFIRAFDEPKTHRNIPVEIRMKYLEKFRNSGIKLIFAGHNHKNSVGFYDGVEVVVTHSMSEENDGVLPGLRIVRVYDNRIVHDYYQMDDLPDTIDLS